MLIAIVLVAWPVVGICSLYWWWTREFDLDLLDAWFLGMVGSYMGPFGLLFLVGPLFNGEFVVMKRRRKR
jgi:hypothetical protein